MKMEVHKIKQEIPLCMLCGCTAEFEIVDKYTARTVNVCGKHYDKLREMFT